jgi:hypothetical protein
LIANCGEDGEGCGRVFVYTGEDVERRLSEVYSYAVVKS